MGSAIRFPSCSISFVLDGATIASFSVQDLLDPRLPVNVRKPSMEGLILLAAITGTVGDASQKELPATHSLRYVNVAIESTPTNARGQQLVTVRLTIQPHHRVFTTSRGVEEFYAPRALTMKLTAATQDPNTRVHVIYPKDHKDGEYAEYGKETAIQVLVQRAPGDRSPVRGQLDFRVMGTLF
jgi:hypothetical protein